MSLPMWNAHIETCIYINIGHICVYWFWKIGLDFERSMNRLINLEYNTFDFSTIFFDYFIQNSKDFIWFLMTIIQFFNIFSSFLYEFLYEQIPRTYKDYESVLRYLRFVWSIWNTKHLILDFHAEVTTDSSLS